MLAVIRLRAGDLIGWLAFDFAGNFIAFRQIVLVAQFYIAGNLHHGSRMSPGSIMVSVRAQNEGTRTRHGAMLTLTACGNRLAFFRESISLLSTNQSATTQFTMAILSTILVGLIVGAIAKLLMPGKDPGGFIVTILLGIAGLS